jgi:hypothetical protein
MTLLGFLIAEIEWNSALDAYVLASHCYVSHQLLSVSVLGRTRHAEMRNHNRIRKSGRRKGIV